MTEEEIWKQHPIYTKYDISTLGEVRRNTDSPYTYAGKILKEFVNLQGYHKLCIRFDGKVRTRPIHQLVIETFVMPISEFPKGHEINHKNGDKGDNRLCNLEIISHSLNVQYAYDRGQKIPLQGEQQGNSTLTNVKVLKIRELCDEGKLLNREIGEMFGVTGECISQIKHRRSWKHI